MYIAIKDAKRFLNDTKKKWEKANKEGLHKLAESGEIEVRYAEHLQEVQKMAVKNFIKIADKLLDNMENAGDDSRN